MFGHFYLKKTASRVLMTNDIGQYAFMDEKEFDSFIKDYMPHDSEKWLSLSEKMFCYDYSNEEYYRRMESQQREYNSYLFDSTNLFIIAVTNECNNQCVYCQANGKSQHKRMSKEVADKILERIAEVPSNNITIEFQGGEPLICFDLIKHVIETAEKVISDKKINFTLVSNLIMLTEDMADFFAQHKVGVSTSLDGPRYLHDKNRPNNVRLSSYDAVMRGRFILNHRGISGGAIETTTALSLKYPKEIVRAYEEMGLHQIFIRPLTRLGAAARAWDKIGYTPDEFLAFYRLALEEIIKLNMEGKEFSDYYICLLLSKILRGKSANYMELRSPCGAAIGQVAFTSNGDVYTCDEGRMVAEMGDNAFKLGNVFDSHYSDWISSPCCKAVCSASLLDSLPGCFDCVYKPYCGTCPVVNYAIQGNISSVVRERCTIYKGILDILFEYLYNNDERVMSIFQRWSELV